MPKKSVSASMQLFTTDARGLSWLNGGIWTA